MSTLAEAATRGIGVADFRPVASYGRISKRRAGDGGGAHVKIEKQHEDHAAYIERLFPGAAVAFYSDNISAWDPNAVRPEWERMLSDIRAGNLRACVAWHADRYTRQPAQLESMWESCKATGTEWHTVRSGHVTNPLMLRIEGALAANDSDLKSEKISRRHRTLAEEGKPHGGRRRFGYTPDMRPLTSELIADENLEFQPEAEIVADLVKRFLDGETLHGLSVSLKERGIVGASGAVMTASNLGLMLRRPHLAGIRVHKGIEHDGSWDPIISREDHEAVCHKLADPSRRTSPSNARVYLAAGILICAECKSPVRGRPLPSGGRAYTCRTGRHAHKSVALVDARISELAIARLEELDAAGAFRDDGAEEKVARLELARDALKEKRAKLADQWADDEISDESYAEKERALAKRGDKLAAELAAAREAARPPLAALDGMTGTRAREAWERASLDKRRLVLRTLFESLELVGSTGRKEAFTPEHVRYLWRDASATA